MAARKIRTTVSGAQAPVRLRADFTTHGALFGGWERPTKYGASTGRLAWSPAGKEYAADLDRALAAGPVFVVYSYGTPIAWFTEADGWTIPDVKYSVTTSRHQSSVRRGATLSGHKINGHAPLPYDARPTRYLSPETETA